MLMRIPISKLTRCTCSAQSRMVIVEIHRKVLNFKVGDTEEIGGYRISVCVFEIFPCHMRQCCCAGNVMRLWGAPAVFHFFCCVWATHADQENAAFLWYIQIKWGAAEKWLIVSGNRLAGGSKLIFNQFDIPSLGFFKVKNQIHLREGGSINWLWFVHKKFNRTVCCLFNVPLWAAARCLPLCMHACVGCWIFLRISRYQAVKRNICHSSDSMEAILPYNSGWRVKYIFELYLLYRFILYVRPAAEIYAKTNLVKCKII